MYIYVRSRQLEKTYNSDPKIGCWPISALRILRGWGAPLEEQWPYVGDIKSWPPKEPVGIDQYANEHKIFAYQRVCSAKECKLALATGFPVTITVEITNSWYAAKMGEIQLPKEGDKRAGGHCVTLFGYDDHKGVFQFQNSWGKEWGNKGYGSLPYRYIDLLLTEGWVIIPHKDDFGCEKSPGTIERVWGIPAILHNVLHGIEIRDSQSNERKSWGFALQYDNHLNVEELFVCPKYRGKGYSRKLCSHFKELSSLLSLPLRFWVSHADNNRNNITIVRHMADIFGFTISDSFVRWAALKVEQERTISQKKSSHTKPGIVHRPLRSSSFAYFSDERYCI